MEQRHIKGGKVYWNEDGYFCLEQKTFSENFVFILAFTDIIQIQKDFFNTSHNTFCIV